MNPRPLAVALLAAATGTAALAALLVHPHQPTPEDRLTAAYEQLAADQEAIALQRQIDGEAPALGLDPGVISRLQTACRADVDAYNQAAAADPAVIAPAQARHLNPDTYCK